MNINISLKKLSTAFLLILPLCSLPAEEAAAGLLGSEGAGSATGQFLKYAVGARAAAMGEAFSAAGDDAFVLDWNPAALMNVAYKSAVFMHSPYLENTSLDYLGFSMNTGDMGAWAVSVKYMNYGSIDKTSESGASLSSFKPHDVAVSIGIATYISDFNDDPENRFVLGAAGKMINSTIDESDSTISADVGLLSPYYFDDRLRFALVIQNVMGSLTFDKESSDLPMIGRAGFSFQYRRYLLFTGDIISTSDSDDAIFAGGAEVKINPVKDMDFAIRGGYNSRKTEDLTGTTNITGGFGISYGSVSFDYAFSPMGELGNVHRMSLSYNFGAPEKTAGTESQNFKF